MNANAELLNFIYQNAQMGVETLHQIIPMTESEPFKKQMNVQLKGYKEFYEKSRALLNDNGYDEKGIGTLEKIMTYLMIDMKTMLDKSASHIAEMMLKGSNMGIIDAIKKIRQYEGDAEKEIVTLMKHLLEFEESNVEELKKYL